MKNKMILWTAGMISLVVVLMIIIVSLEPPKGRDYPLPGVQGGGASDRLPGGV